MDYNKLDADVLNVLQEAIENTKGYMSSNGIGFDIHETLVSMEFDANTFKRKAIHKIFELTSGNKKNYEDLIKAVDEKSFLELEAEYKGNL